MTELPLGWQGVPLGSLLREPLRNGHSAKASGSDQGVPTLTLTAVTNGDFSDSNIKMTVADPDKVRALWIQPGDIFVQRSNTPALVGTARLYRGAPDRAVFPDLLIRVRLNDQADPRYVEAFLQSPAARTYFRTKAQGIAGSMPKIDQAAIEALRVPLAAKDEQAAIVGEIEKQLTRVDAGVAALLRVQANLKRYRASVLKAACEGRLVPTEAELARRESRDYEPASVLLQRILKDRHRLWEESELAKLKAKGKPPKHDRWRARYDEAVPPGSAPSEALPGGWSWASFDALTVNHDGKRVPLKRADRAQRRGAFPYYGASGPIDTIDDFLFDGEYLLIGEDGANLLSRSTPIAFPAHGRFWVNNHAHVVTTVPGVLLGYLEIVLNATNLAPYVTGTAQPKLPQAAMNKIPIPLPPLTEQRRIVTEVQRRFSLIEDCEQTVERRRLSAARLRQSVLASAFAGNLIPAGAVDSASGSLREAGPTSKRGSRQPKAIAATQVR